MLVVDASLLVDVLIRTDRGVRAAKALARGDLVAPELLDVEVLSALARLGRAGVLAPAAADRAASLLTRIPVARISHVLLARQAWRLRDRVRLADGFYVACARVVGAPLLTTDARLAGAPLPGITVTVVS